MREALEKIANHEVEEPAQLAHDVLQGLVAVVWIVEQHKLRGGHDWWIHGQRDLCISKMSAEIYAREYEAQGLRIRITPLYR